MSVVIPPSPQSQADGNPKGHPQSELSPQPWSNRLVLGDCLDLIYRLPDHSIDLIYIDPPFFSGRDYKVVFGDDDEVRSFKDRWDDGLLGYLGWLSERLEAMRRLLKPTGSIYVHLDWHAVHYVKVEMDKLFGMENFLNHIVWLYGLGGSSPRYWPRKHDDILWYSKESNGHYFVADKIKARSTRMKGMYKKAPDYWDIATINNMSKERIGYPTQKPKELLTRIVKSSCPPGGVVADFFCGGGTTGVVAQDLEMGWICCDISPSAIKVTQGRLEKCLKAQREAGITPKPYRLESTPS